MFVSNVNKTALRITPMTAFIVGNLLLLIIVKVSRKLGLVSVEGIA
jgi:hypothetical protein